jgi:hypothetical protein
MPGESVAFTTRVEPVSPPGAAAGIRFVAIGIAKDGGKWWRRRVPPPGPQRLFRKPFIAIVGRPT